MSRLPRLRSSSPDHNTHVENAPTTSYVNTRKRKSTIDEENEGEGEDTFDSDSFQPRKVAALGTARPTRSRCGTTTAPQAPLVPSKSAGNFSNSTSTSGKVPTLSSSNFGKGLNQVSAHPRPARGTRGTSAPPTSNGPARVPVRPTPTTTARTGRAISSKPPSRAAPGTSRNPPPTLNNIQMQLASLDAARQADAERLALEMAAERSKVSELQSNHLALSRELSTAKAQELTHRRELVNFTDELEDMRKKHRKEIMELEMDMRKREREAREATEDLRVTRGDLDRERISNETLRMTLTTQTQTQLTLSAENDALKFQLSSLQRAFEATNIQLADAKQLVEEKEKLVVEMKKEVFESETIRRKLHNMVLELKGNIRVFCRVRPVLPSDIPPQAKVDPEELKARIAFPDKKEHKEIVLHSTSESAMGIERKEVYNFGFDRVFEPESTQTEVFEEISQLAQSCIDGYNVCIFAYGQTGSGKSFTMEGGPTETTAGMIPRAVEKVFRVAEEMKSKGWEYKIEGQFLEIYNETIHDLLSLTSAASTKHEIKHDLKSGRTSVTELTVIPLHSPSQVKLLLNRAQGKRSVAATLMNERSSRSHSVFTLRISGVHVGARAGASPRDFTSSPKTPGGGGEGDGANALVGTGERCEGCLNLVDLAGSERLNVSFGPGVTEKERVKETQSINKSLSALGDVISALGERGGGRETGHIPYRNSKLTYLLQNSLSGNSKTLMVLNLSPLAAHLNESLTSLRFATKVNSTQIGTAKKQVKASLS